MASPESFHPRQVPVAHGRSLEIGPNSVVMGILNVTPDSFSDGGRNLETGSAVETARQMVADGAGIIDIGGESTRPGADPVSPDDERARILPVFRALSAEFGPDGPLLSVDTYRAETARLALEAGAHIVNDVWGLRREPEMAKVAADAGAGIIVMHTGRERDKLPNVMADQFHWFEPSLDMAAKAGIDRGRILLDPGFGFAKDTAENVELMARMAELNVLGLPIVAGTSRKRFIGALTGREAADERDAGTAATSVLLRLAGASIFRVHDVRINRDALAIADAVIAENMRGQ
nr:dihydropteroate synthase [Pseudohoeflea suaedae]